MTTSYSEDMIIAISRLDQIEESVRQFFIKNIPLYPQLFEISFRITDSLDPEFPCKILFLEHLRDNETLLVGFPLMSPLNTVFLLPLLKGSKGHRLKDLNLLDATDNKISDIIDNVIIKIIKLELHTGPRPS